MISLRKLAKQNNVSVSTVSRALRDDPSVKEETKLRIQEAALRHNYMPNRLVEGVFKGRTRLIAVINSNISIQPHSSMVETIIDETTQRGWGCVVYNTHNDPEREAKCIHQAMSLRVSGLVIATINYNAREAFFYEINKYKIPFVLTSEYGPDVAVPHIHGNDDTEASKIVDHLYELGHRQIGIVAGPQDAWGNCLRHSGLLKRASELKLKLPPSRIVPSNWSNEGGYQGAHNLLDAHPEVTAVICENDNIAMGAYNALKERSLRVPQDVSLVGFGDHTMGQYLDPPLTTVKHDMADIGRRCAEVLFELMEKPDDMPLPRRLLDIPVAGEFIVRKSTGPAPKRARKSARK